MSINKQAVSHYLFGFMVIFFAAISPVAYAQDLLEIYGLALQNDPILKQAQASQLAINESKNQSVANFLPTVSATGIDNLNRLNNLRVTYQGGGIQKYSDQSFNVNLTQPLLHWEHWIQLSQSDNQIAQAEAAMQPSRLLNSTIGSICTKHLFYADIDINLLEVGVAIVEGVGYTIFMRCKWQKGFGVSILVNGFSYGAGLLINNYLI